MPTEAELVTLREITRETVRDVCRLEVGPGQGQFVASAAVSIAEAHFSPEAWFRAIYAGEVPVGELVPVRPPGSTPPAALGRVPAAR